MSIIVLRKWKEWHVNVHLKVECFLKIEGLVKCKHTLTNA